MLDLRRLRLLHELHRRGTVGAVAEALSYSPSTVSQQLAVLQREAGTTLFEPAGRRVRLTDAALVLADHAEQLLAAAERAEADLAAAAGAVVGVVRVGSFQTASLNLLLPAMAALGAAHPGLDLRLVEMEPERSLDALRSHQIDLVLADEWTGATRPRLAGVDREDLFTERVEVLLARGHPALRGAGPVALADLEQAVWVAGEPGGGMEALVQRVCREHGRFEPRIHHHTNELTMLVALVDAGHAITLLPEMAAAGAPPGVAMRPLAGVELDRTVFTATRTGSDHRPALAAARAALRDAAATRTGRSSARP